MSIRNLEWIFQPRSVALIGASNRACSVGLVTARNLLGAGFSGPIMPVTPKYPSVAGVLAYPDVASLPATPDLAVICTLAAAVPKLIAELGTRGTKAAIVISAGFKELGTVAGRELELAVLEAARPHLMRVVGPNCLGVVSTPAQLNASFAPGQAHSGGIAFVAQSGAVVTTVLDWANARGFGFSRLVSLGDMADVDFGDMLDYLANDTATTAVLLYVEAVTNSRKFMSAARAASRVKPVIAIKAGRHEAGAQAIRSHTGALAGVDAVYDAAFRRAGILRVRELEDIFEAAITLAACTASERDDLVIVTNGGGAGVLAVDALLDHGGRLTQLSADTIAKLDGVLPKSWPHANPVDIIGDAPAQRYAAALETVLAAPETHAVLVMNCPTAIASSADAARAVIGAAVRQQKPVLTNWLGAANAADARRLFSEAGLASFETPGQAARAFMHMVNYRRGQRIILEAPSSRTAETTPRRAQAMRIVDDALRRDESWLDPDTVRDLLICYNIPVPRTERADTPEAAARVAARFDGPVALKIISPDVTHKSDVGGVILNLEGDAAVRDAAERMRDRVARIAPHIRLHGFQIQEMIRRPDSFETIAGMGVDAQFGPVILFGQGGTAVEIIADRALALPPLNPSLCRELIEQTRLSRQLRGFRGRPPVKLDALVRVLVSLSQLACDLDEVAELEINPLLVDERGVVALDARARVAPFQAPRGARLAIRPYPDELRRKDMLPGIGQVVTRPVRPQDWPALKELLEHATAPAALPSDAALAARLSQIDYDREMVFVAERADAPDSRLLAATRLIADPDNLRAELAVSIRSDLDYAEICGLLVHHNMAYARSRQTEELACTISAADYALLQVCRRMGFTIVSSTDRPSDAVMRLTKQTSTTRRPAQQA